MPARTLRMVSVRLSSTTLVASSMRVPSSLKPVYDIRAFWKLVQSLIARASIRPAPIVLIRILTISWSLFVSVVRPRRRFSIKLTAPSPRMKYTSVGIAVARVETGYVATSLTRRRIWSTISSIATPMP